MSEVIRYGERDLVYHLNRGNSLDEMVLATDFDAEHALRLQAERQVGELREQRDSLANEMFDLQGKLDTAMGLLREVTDAGDYYDKHGEICPFEGEPMIYAETLTRLADGVRAFLNTTSTEGKDHE